MSAPSATLPPAPACLVQGAVTLWLAKIVPSNGQHGFVPYYHFRITVWGTDIGHLNFRVGDTDHVRLYAGHIGFEIAEGHRGHRYALQACQAVAPLVRKVSGEVILTCNPDNHASRRTIEHLGATFLEEVTVPPHDPCWRGARSKLRFRWNP